MTKLDEKGNKALYSAQDEFLIKLSVAIADQAIDNSILLCGGTALARCYLDHRVSYDLDFFVDGQFNPEKLASRLGKFDINIEDIQIENDGKFVNQLFGFCNIGDVKLKVSFIEDSYSEMFECSVLLIGNASFNVESIDGLYHRKLRTVSGSGYGDRPTDGRQAARDLFDLYMLDILVKPIPEFIEEINSKGANFPEKAFIAGLGAMHWIDMMDDFEQMDIKSTHPSLIHIKKGYLMSEVKLRIDEIYREMVNGQNFKP